MAAPPLCLLTADFYFLDGRPAAYMGLVVSFDYALYALHSGAGVGGSLRFRADKNGHLELSLIQGLNYKVHLEDLRDVPLVFTCPVSDTADLLAYLFPYAVSVGMSEDSYEVELGGNLSVQAVVTYSDGVEELRSDLVTFQVGDATKATVSGSVVTGEEVGSTTIEVSSFDVGGLQKQTDWFGLEFVRLSAPSPELLDPVTLTVLSP